MKKIIPEDGLALNAYDHIQPAFDKLMDDIQCGEYDGHGQAFVKGVVDLALTYGKFSAKFFHFTKATVKSMGKLDWKPFDDYIARVVDDRMRRLDAAWGREQQVCLLKSSTGSSTSTHRTGSSRSSEKISTTSSW